MSDQDPAPTAMGIYIFAGGFTLGVKQAGFNVLAQLEDGMYGVETTRKNHPGLPVFTDVPTWPLEAFAGKVDFIYGNPPCAPFSVSASSPLKDNKNRWMADPRVKCIHNTFHALEVVRPKVWVWESVQQAWIKGRPLVDALTERAAKLGYSATYVLLNAAHLGVPQARRRFFCVFHNIVIPWEYPAPEDRVIKTVRNAIGALPDPNPEIYPNTYPVSFLKKMRPGEGPRPVWERENPDQRKWKRNKTGGILGRPGFNSRRLRWDEPSFTMIGGAHLYHPEEHRLLSVREAQVLCGYPPGYEFVSRSVGQKYAQIAQAVMPPVGRWLATNVRRALEDPTPELTPRRFIADFEKGKVTQI